MQFKPILLIGRVFMQFYDFFVFVLKASFVVLITLSILIGVVLPLVNNFRGRSQARSIKSPVRNARSGLPLFLPEEEEVEIPSADAKQVVDNKEIVKMALEDPTKTTLLIRNWIQEKK